MNETVPGSSGTKRVKWLVAPGVILACRRVGVAARRCCNSLQPPTVALRFTPIDRIALRRGIGLAGEPRAAQVS